MNAICLVIDRLHAGYLGCYGNCWIATPQFDHLASTAFVFDQAIIDSPDLGEIYRSYWQGSHALGRFTSRQPSLVELLSAGGVATTMLTDAPLPLGGLREGLAEVVEVPLPSNPQSAADPSETHLANFFAAAIEWLQSAREPFCLWLHTQGLAGPWDAPLDYRNRYADPEEPLPPRVVTPPHMLLPKDYDPDELLGYSQAYAGQVTLLDTCLGALVEFLESSPLSKNTLLSVTSARGFALGEHRRIGAWDAALHGELIHVPWLLRFPDQLGAAMRSQALVQPYDLMPTLTEWWDLRDSQGSPFAASLMPVVRDEADAVRGLACTASTTGERGLRTPAWYMRHAQAAADDAETFRSARLYAKPDDRWEANDVADRCLEVAESLERILAESETALANRDVDQMPTSIP